MKNIVSTYRIQFHKDFTFEHLKKILPYLKKLGITTIYASPVFTAVKGSNHGYDLLDPSSVNPEIGSNESFIELLKEVKSLKMNWMQDIVPNHMAFFPENPWIADLLEKGESSIYASFFDVDFEKGPVMLPFLGADASELIEKGEITIAYENEKLVLKYFDNAYPLKPGTYRYILKNSDPSDSLQQLEKLITEALQQEDRNIFKHQWNEILVQLHSLWNDKNLRTTIQKTIAKINSNVEALKNIADEQHYRLCNWKETDSQINYRRFFTVNSLICLNIQNKDVFEQHHSFILSLVKQNLISGLRIDHIDGLFDPTGYLKQLREAAGDIYISVEKILKPGEHLPTNWPVEGTTGYDFLALANNLLTQNTSEEKLTLFYNSLVDEKRSVSQQVRDKKSMILYQNMGGELENLFVLFMTSGIVNEEDYAQMRTEDIKTAIAEFLIHCPVYRFYGNEYPLAEEEQNSLQKVFTQIKTSRPDLSAATDLLAQVMLFAKNSKDEKLRSRCLYFFMRCMQFTGPLMAKGVEDTLMYTYNRFIAHNEVGDAPGAFGITLKDMHDAMLTRKHLWPHTQNATSTHDTKRGEDVRARLNVISQMPELWIEKINEWQHINKDLRVSGAPDVNDEYFIYQTLAGSWPVGNFDIDDYKNRLQEYFIKAFREAKRITNWNQPNERYEAAIKEFTASLLEPSNPFYKSFTRFIGDLTDAGIHNSIAQLVLKTIAPGIPDIYQGTELWDLSLVDPDNRRPVDYELRKNILNEIEDINPQLVENLWKEKRSGKFKLYILNKLLQLRNAYPNVFLNGEYIPLEITGKYKEFAFSFARSAGNTMIVVTIPLLSFNFKSKEKFDWANTTLRLPASKDGWKHVLLHSKTDSKEILLNDLFDTLPVSVLAGNTPGKERSAGILLHLSSLPSVYGCGDMGSEAYSFVNALSSAGLKYWQILPLNPTEEGQGFSPYSATSSFAGNPLFINPELLAEQQLLHYHEFAALKKQNSTQADFNYARQVKEKLLLKAFENFKLKGENKMASDFSNFKTRERSWLNDFALFSLLKKNNNGLPWYEWEEKQRNPDNAYKDLLENRFRDQVEFYKWIQFIFDLQWKSLKHYSNEMGVKIMGDLPFYVSYDSADVWSHPSLFMLDENGSAKFIAGVPPDAFSNEGQLWGMPVYNWQKHEETGYNWWIKRLKKNIEYFDLVRLDHFRAFDAYWEVKASEETAKNGRWVNGPGKKFFTAIHNALGELPFVAEDLGEITPSVHTLRDAFGLPGMKVLQFAFGENFNTNEHIPHHHEKNFLVYTGTHDNNTIKGWYRTETDAKTRERISGYFGMEITENNVAFQMCKMAMASVANIAILPLQDVLALNETSRMNIPSSTANNWSWSMSQPLRTRDLEEVKKWIWFYNR